MTGYMFKNAEYRLSMSQSLGMYEGTSSNLLLTGVGDDFLDNEEDPLVSKKIKGKLKIRYGKKDEGKSKEPKETISASNGNLMKNKVVDSNPTSSDSPIDDSMEIEVDAAAYMSELRLEVSKLREELIETN